MMRLTAPFNFQIENCKLKIILLSSIFYLLSFAFIAPNVSAQTNVPTKEQNPYTAPNTNPDVPKNLHTYTQNVIIEIMSAATCQLTGIDPTSPKQQCLGVDQKTGKIGFVPSSDGGGGAIGVMSHMISMLYTIPVNSGDYGHYLAQNFGIAKPAYAQGTGFEGLKPVLGLWTAFRNVVYLIFTIVFVVIGLLIMFRVKIDPRTVMTIQNQIPRIIIGLLLLTFSFAIAGFLIDLMYVVIFLGYELISTAAKSPDLLKNLNPLFLQDATPFQAAEGIKTRGIFGIAGSASRGFFWLIESIIDSFINDNLPTYTLAIIGAIFGSVLGGFVPVPIIGNVIGAALGTIIGALSKGFISEVLAGLAYLIVFLIIVVALLFTLIRLWFSLIMAYVGILLDVVLAPFWIAASLLPGSTIGFGAWARSIIANLAAFPATIFMFLLAKVFIDSFGEKPQPTDFVPPLIGEISHADTLGNLIGLGIIFMTPGVVAMVKAALKAPGVPGVGLIGTAIGAGASPYMAGTRTTMAALTPTPKLGERGGFGAAARQIFRF